MEHRFRTDKPVWGEAPGGSSSFYQVRFNRHAPQRTERKIHVRCSLPRTLSVGTVRAIWSR